PPSRIPPTFAKLYSLPEFASKALLYIHAMRFAMALAVALSASALLADSRTYEIRKDPKNLVEFHAEDTYDAFDGRTNNVSGTIVADAANPSAARVDLSIDLASLDTGISLRNREMRERYLQTPKFPAATFKSVSVVAPDAIAPNQPVDLR